jgi:hypothetical protein
VVPCCTKRKLPHFSIVHVARIFSSFIFLYFLFLKKGCRVAFLARVYITNFVSQQMESLLYVKGHALLLSSVDRIEDSSG